MPFWRTYYHLVWTTKERRPLIQPEIEHRLFRYIIYKASELGVYVYAINGWFDHLHLIVSIPPKVAVAEVVKHLKGASSHDLNASGELPEPFEWQRGYGVLTMGERQRESAERYVQGQKTHHRQQTSNDWLERCSESDEGPSDSSVNPRAMRDEGDGYVFEFEDEVPF